MILHPVFNMALHHLLPLFLVYCALFTLSSSASAASDKVNVSLYYETLCGGCSRFMVNNLTKLFSTGLIDIVNLHLAPYGNARVDQDGEISCQHGEDECFLNSVEACAIHTWPDPKQHWPFLECVEALVLNGNYTDWESCFDSTGLPSQPIQDCYISGLGDQLQRQYGNETDSLNPPHKYVPWVVVNGEPLYENFNDFMKFVCKAYKGTPKPEACQNLLSPVVFIAEDLSAKQVCPAMNVPPVAP